MRNLPRVTKNLIIINAILLFAEFIFRNRGIDLNMYLGMFPVTNSMFHFWQPVTYMFMHQGFWHFFCNMFAVLMFAPELERCWGEKRFLIFYFVCGIGAAIVQQVVWLITGTTMAITIGASGAVFGILFAFGWLFPEVKMFLLFIPIPISSRVFVALYALFELWEGLVPTAGDNVAHFAHLGGMLFGWLLILWWKHKGFNYSQAGDYQFQMPAWLQNIWQKIKNWFRQFGGSSKKAKDTSYANYHYQDPISNTTSPTSSTTSKLSDEDNEEINRILDKVKHSGYDSLTSDEKAKLFKR